VADNAPVLILWNWLVRLLWPLLYFYRPFRGTIGQRLGRFELGSYDPQSIAPRYLINAVSAGEVVAVSGLVRELKRRAPDAQIVLLTTTRSGQTMAAQRLADVLSLSLYFPLLDMPAVSQRYLQRLQPLLYVTTEAELWPNMQRHCNRLGIPAALVNGRLYMHNKRGLRLRLTRTLLAQLDLVACTDETQRANFAAVGVPAEKLVVTGNLKFDISVEDWDAQRSSAWQERFGTAGGHTVVAGSTHPGEEELLLNALQQLRDTGSRIRMVIAPRHIDRADEVLKLAEARGCTALPLSGHQPGAAWDVLVVDSYGVLQDMYRLADVVVMGGSFSEKVGGHNLLEATALGKHVIVGPHTFSIAAQVALLWPTMGLWPVDDDYDGDELTQLTRCIEGILQLPQERIEEERAALVAVTSANGGAALRTADALEALLRKRAGQGA
jgi:3-deoxy-D-manno-octulosonic-acid transferase